MLEKELAKDWTQSGISTGDTVLLHSDLRRIIRRFVRQGERITPGQILDSFLDAVGPSGTLLLPLFNFDFTKGVPFVMRSTPSQMGALTEAGRLHPQAVRTGHPIYSFAVIGQHAKRFERVNNFSGYGSDSPFAILRELGGKISVLDLPDKHSLTFVHHVEEMHEVPYRYHKTFAGDYTDSDGRTGRRTYGLFVRNVEKGVLSGGPIGELMWEKGVYKGCLPNEGTGLRVASANSAYDLIAEVITSGKAMGMLYSIAGEDSA